MLRTVALISGLYDTVVGALLLCASGWVAETFGVAPPSPPIFSDLNALFLLCIGAGYYLPWRDPVRYRGYMWVMGPLLKGGGFKAMEDSGGVPSMIRVTSLAGSVLLTLSVPK